MFLFKTAVLVLTRVTYKHYLKSVCRVRWNPRKKYISCNNLLTEYSTKSFDSVVASSAIGFQFHKIEESCWCYWHVLVKFEVDVNKYRPYCTTAFNNFKIVFYPIWLHTSLSKYVPLQGVDLNPRDREKCTPLLLAAAHGCSAVVSLLLESGADVTSEDDKKRTALHWAVGQDRTIERLLKVWRNDPRRDPNWKTRFQY